MREPRTPATADLLTEREAAKRLGLAPSTLKLLRHRGGGPEYIAIRTRSDVKRPAIRYASEALARWLSSRATVHTSTSDPGRPLSGASA
jgi:hypothetical protein